MLFAISDAVWLGLFGLIAVLIKEHFDRERAKDTAARVAGVAEDLKHENATIKQEIHKIEVATNSMKDALVKATGDAKLLEGEKAGREAQRIEHESRG